MPDLRNFNGRQFQKMKEGAMVTFLDLRQKLVIFRWTLSLITSLD